MNSDRNMLLLYAVTDRNGLGKQTLYEKIEQALGSGVTVLQLREKNLSEEEYIAQAKEIKNLCRRYNVPLIVNDNVEVALKSGADGVHVGMDDTPVAEIRKRVGKDFIIGATAKTVEQALNAEKGGADYLGVGAVFASPTKTNAIRITAQKLKEICLSVSIPVVAIGGITLQNVSEIFGCGMSGIAVSSAIFSAKNVAETVSELKQKAKEAVLLNVKQLPRRTD